MFKIVNVYGQDLFLRFFRDYYYFFGYLSDANAYCATTQAYRSFRGVSVVFAGLNRLRRLLAILRAFYVRCLCFPVEVGALRHVSGHFYRAATSYRASSIDANVGR